MQNNEIPKQMFAPGLQSKTVNVDYEYLILAEVTVSDQEM